MRDNTDDPTPALDIAGILAIHRDPAGYICFVRKPDPAAAPRLDKHGKPYAWENLGAIRTDKLGSMFPALASWLTHDSYMTVNDYFRAAPWPNPLTGLPDVLRKEKYLRSLTACYCDVDCGRPDSDEPGGRLFWRQAQHWIELLADAGVIPQPSIIARSGRGIYIFWFLCDERYPDQLPHAWPEKVTIYKAINRAFIERLRTHQLPADKLAIDAARVLRVPGSIHRKAQRRVQYVLQADAAGRGFVYTLSELAAFLDLQAPAGELPTSSREMARPAQYRKTKERGTVPLRSNGTRRLNALRAQDMLVLEAWRGGFLKRGMKYPDGSTSPGRRFTLGLYANCLRGSGVDRAEALAAVLAMASNTRPAYPSDPDDTPVADIVEAEYSTTSRRRWGNAVLCSLFHITADVARTLDLATIRPASVAIEADQARPTKADAVAYRQAFVAQYIAAHGTPSTRQLARVLYDAGFSRSAKNQQTASEDLNALGYVTQRSRGGRPSLLQQAPQGTAGNCQETGCMVGEESAA
jgi:hypothetical protein